MCLKLSEETGEIAALNDLVLFLFFYGEWPDGQSGHSMNEN
jgi:hypothetical protein